MKGDAGEFRTSYLPNKHAADLQFQIWSTNRGSAAPAWIQLKKPLNRFWILKARSNENHTKAAASGIESVIQMRGMLWGVRMKTGLDSTGLVPTDCLKWGTDLKQVLCVDRFGEFFFPLFLFFLPACLTHLTRPMSKPVYMSWKQAEHVQIG